MKKLLVFLFCGLVLFVTTSFADLPTGETNTTKVEALESDPTKYKKFSSSRTSSILSSIILSLTNVTRKYPENLDKIEYLKRQKEEYETLLRVHLAGEEMCNEYKKLALLSESNESTIDYYPTYENLCFLPIVIN
ncbi:hypothetical protein [Candidatus Endomicrobiellum devescovinae]|jgi:hypothetical protein|uniref:hypothetical protein n=1 Tax=Candidatus Endomicrobiellum devescovinae TaxID=3242322 RepID=UPI0028274DA8|nr:hypothetical protein [Endomicrobium sp.]